MALLQSQPSSNIPNLTTELFLCYLASSYFSELIFNHSAWASLLSLESVKCIPHLGGSAWNTLSLDNLPDWLPHVIQASAQLSAQLSQKGCSWLTYLKQLLPPSSLPYVTSFFLTAHTTYTFVFWGFMPISPTKELSSVRNFLCGTIPGTYEVLRIICWMNVSSLY